MTDSAYRTEIEVAKIIGRSTRWLRGNRPMLEREGFPRIDGLIGMTCVMDIEAWIAKRRQVSDAIPVGEHHADASNGDDYDKL